MTPEQASQLCQRLLKKDARIGCDVKPDKTTMRYQRAGARVLKLPFRAHRIVFTGPTGEHSLDVEVSTPDRVEKHWEGFKRNTFPPPQVGDTISFRSRSSSSGWRTGKVKKVGPKRVTIEFKFKHGGESTANVKHEDTRTKRR